MLVGLGAFVLEKLVLVFRLLVLLSACGREVYDMGGNLRAVGSRRLRLNSEILTESNKKIKV